MKKWALLGAAFVVATSFVFMTQTGSKNAETKPPEPAGIIAFLK